MDATTPIGRNPNMNDNTVEGDSVPPDDLQDEIACIKARILKTPGRPTEHLADLYQAMRSWQKDSGANDKQVWQWLCQVEVGHSTAESAWGNYLAQAKAQGSAGIKDKPGVISDEKNQRLDRLIAREKEVSSELSAEVDEAYFALLEADELTPELKARLLEASQLRNVVSQLAHVLWRQKNADGDDMPWTDAIRATLRPRRPLPF